MDRNRRLILKKVCFGGLGVCGISVSGCSQQLSEGSKKPQVPKQDTLPYQWISSLLPLIDANTERDCTRKIIKGCAAAHYDQLRMDKTVARFEGKLEDFLEFLTTEWGWIIEYSKQDGVIKMNENKDRCVCPLVRKEIGMKSPSLCYCSEGFAEKMFSAVVGFPVHAEVTESILRGAKSCKYRIDLNPSNKGNDTV